jgi:hypothetical protein
MEIMISRNDRKDPLNPDKASSDNEGKTKLPESDLEKVAGGESDTVYYKATCSYCGWYWSMDTYANTAAQAAAHNALGNKHNAVITEDSYVEPPVQN